MEYHPLKKTTTTHLYRKRFGRPAEPLKAPPEFDFSSNPRLVIAFEFLTA